MKEHTAGRFDTTTKTKISTEHGTILKVTFYQDGSIIEEYRIRPKCSICKDNIPCICFNEDNSDEPFKEAFNNLQMRWICTEAECQITEIKSDDPDYYQELFEKHKGNIDEMVEDHLDNLDGGLETGDFCQV